MTEQKTNIGTRCPECGFKIRGNNHRNGLHHVLSKEANKHESRPTRKAKVG